MADTFTSTGVVANCWVYSNGIERDYGSRTVSRIVPWASNVVIDQMGPTIPTLTVTVYTTSATQAATLFSLRGGRGVFDWGAGTEYCVLETVVGQNYMGYWRDLKLTFRVEA